MLISIIVPVYNVEKYIADCLESIAKQSYQNIEVIIVNDGSTDNSIQICKDYAEKDKRFKIITQKNQGLSAARNTGMNYVNGEYTIFIDSDDKISIHLVDKCVNIIHNFTDISMVFFSHYIHTNDKIITDSYYEGIDSGTYSPEDMVDNLLKEKVQINAWSYMFNSSLMKKNFFEFPEGLLYEDMVPIVTLIHNSKKIYYLNEPLYIYSIRKGSITSATSIKARVDHITNLDNFSHFITNNYPNLINQLKHFQIKIYIQLLGEICEENIIMGNTSSVKKSEKVHLMNRVKKILNEKTIRISKKLYLKYISHRINIFSFFKYLKIYIRRN
ncbi:glycosyltransferase family 2 protein [Leuconostoc fallax]|uniref:Glycosyltransferase 2-like domain-containing protein n=1 Tax=Leuconostoc fallax TaxID=1251 RepID=A0A4V3A2L3_9LACO|nr:glycosyltransferase [Leuconostoc fallax]MBU7454891.1 glycosyltransferase [Leuconostoc fallax]TDG69455.1 hypothetical protein C5L23_000917 [Leuconostoc fallax]